VLRVFEPLRQDEGIVDGKTQRTTALSGKEGHKGKEQRLKGTGKKGKILVTRNIGLILPFLL